MSERTINGLVAAFFVSLIVSLAQPQTRAFAGTIFGHFIGISGFAMILLTLRYPFRKRILGKRGIENPLHSHVVFGLLGPTLTVFHSGLQTGSLIAVMTFGAMLTAVLSGMIGRVFYRRVSRALQEQRKELKMLKELFRHRRREIEACKQYFGLHRRGDPSATREQEMWSPEEQKKQCENLYDLARSISELEYTAAIFDSTKSLFSKWKRIHHLLAMLFFSLVLLHIAAALRYGLRWIT